MTNEEKNEPLFLWTLEFRPWWSQKKRNFGITSDPGTWKQDARRAELPNVGKEDTDDTTMWKSLLPASCVTLAGDYYEIRLDTDDGW